MKPETTKKQEAEISLIKRLTQKQLIYGTYREREELKTAEQRRLKEFHKKEDKKNG